MFKKINPHEIVVPFLVMVEPEQRLTIVDFEYSFVDDYTYYVLRIKLPFPSVGTHLSILKLVNTPPPSIVTNVS